MAEKVCFAALDILHEFVVAKCSGRYASTD
jgi:hypothetical protein